MLGLTFSLWTFAVDVGGCLCFCADEKVVLSRAFFGLRAECERFLDLALPPTEWVIPVVIWFVVPLFLCFGCFYGMYLS